MHKILTILGAITLVLILCGGAAIGYAVYVGHQMDAESKAFVDNAVPAIVKNWDHNKLIDIASPELREASSDDQIRTAFAGFARLGDLVDYRGSTGQSTLAFMLSSGSTISATYVAKAVFQNGEAEIQVTAVKRNGRWMVQGFHVDGKSSGEAQRQT